MQDVMSFKEFIGIVHVHVGAIGHSKAGKFLGWSIESRVQSGCSYRMMLLWPKILLGFEVPSGTASSSGGVAVCSRMTLSALQCG